VADGVQIGMVLFFVLGVVGFSNTYIVGPTSYPDWINNNLKNQRIIFYSSFTNNETLPC